MGVWGLGVCGGLGLRGFVGVWGFGVWGFGALGVWGFGALGLRFGAKGLAGICANPQSLQGLFLFGFIGFREHPKRP